MLKYMRIPSTAGRRDTERSRFFHKLSGAMPRIRRRMSVGCRGLEPPTAHGPAPFTKDGVGLGIQIHWLAVGLVASFLVAEHGLGGTLEAGGDARPISDREVMVSDSLLPYAIRSARDTGTPHLCALASEGAYPITTSTARGFGRRAHLGLVPVDMVSVAKADFPVFLTQEALVAEAHDVLSRRIVNMSQNVCAKSH